MNRFTDQQIQEGYSALPKKVQEYIESTHFKNVMRGLAEVLGLHIDKAGVLYEETLFLLLGLTKADDLVKNLEKSLSIQEKEAVETAEALSDHVLTPLRQDILGAPDTEEVEVQEKPAASKSLISAPRYGDNDPYRESIE